MNVLSLFNGLGSIWIVLDQLGVSVDHRFASEINVYANKINDKYYPNTIHFGDIRNINTAKLPKIDLLVGGSPCQDFSKAKKGKGINGNKSFLFWNFLSIYNDLKPTYFLLENVDTKKTDIINNYFGQPYKINTDLFLPQNRARRYWTNIPIQPLPNRPTWGFSYGQKVRRDFNGIRPMTKGTSPTLLKAMGTGGGNMPYIKENGIWRVLNINELEQLQGLPLDYTKGVSLTQRKIMIGNGWSLPVIKHILKGINTFSI